MSSNVRVFMRLEPDLAWLHIIICASSLNCEEKGAKAGSE
jgi:hypothetical protein